MFKPIFIVTLVLCLLGGGLFFYQNSVNKTDSEDISAHDTGKKILEKLDTKALNQIKITSENSEIRLTQKQGGGWKEQSTDYEANVQNIQNLLLKLSQTQLGDLITNKPERHKLFHLDTPPDDQKNWNNENNGIELSLLHGDESSFLSLQLGKKRTQSQGQYIRFSDSNKIFLIPEMLTVETEVSEWLDKDLLALESAQIKGLSFLEAEQTIYSIIRENENADWIPKDSQYLHIPEIDKLKQLLNRLSNLKFSKLHLQSTTETTQDAVKNSEFTLTVSLFDNSIYTLTLMPAATNADLVMSLRMGIALGNNQDSSDTNSILKQNMERFNQQVGGRLFEIQSWEAQELMLKNEE